MWFLCCSKYFHTWFSTLFNVLLIYFLLSPHFMWPVISEQQRPHTKYTCNKTTLFLSVFVLIPMTFHSHIGSNSTSFSIFIFSVFMCIHLVWNARLGLFYLYWIDSNITNIEIKIWTFEEQNKIIPFHKYMHQKHLISMVL